MSKKNWESKQSANEEPLLKEAIFRIGKVISVEGRKVTISVDKSKNSSHLFYKGEVLKNVTVGGYVKILKGFSIIIGKVDGEFIQEDKTEKSKIYKSNRDKIFRVLNVSLLGFFDKKRFKRGVKELPLIDNECFLLEREEFYQVHNFVPEDDKSLTIGTLSLESGQDISFGINRLFASHIGIFGNTGSGKSYTLTKLYHELFKKYKKSKNFIKRAKFLLIDFNGEYVEKNAIVEEEYKNTYDLSTRSKSDKLPILSEYLNEPLFWTILLEATDKTQQPFLGRAVKNRKASKAIEGNESFHNWALRILENIFRQNSKNLDKNIVINYLKALKSCMGPKVTGLSVVLDDYLEHLHWHTKGASYVYATPSIEIYANNADFLKTVVTDKFTGVEFKVEEISLLEKIRLKIVVQYYDEITRGYSNVEHLAPLIGRLDQRISDLNKIIEVKDEINHSKNFTIVSLRDVNLHMKKIIPMLICNQVYSEKKTENDDQKYLNIIIDEAHNILSYESQRESEHWKDFRLETFEEIIKEGRKFGVFLTLASQRPSDISSTIISQLHNYFLHRLINQHDIQAVEKTISYLDRVSFESLPILATGTAIIAGQFSDVPVMVDISKIDAKYEPKNKTMTLVDKWEA